MLRCSDAGVFYHGRSFNSELSGRPLHPCAEIGGRKRYPLVLMLEPLFRCNLACAGCGKIDYPDETLDQRLSVEECIGAAEECGAPIVSIAGGEPLIHKDMPAVVAGLVERKRFVYLCTNALLLKKRMDDYQPSPYLTFSVHLDGNEHRHDESVCQPGTYQRAADAIREAVAKGFRVTVNCTLFQGEGAEEVASFLDECKALDVEGVTISPGFNYERAPQQEVFIQRRASRQLFRDIFRIGKERKAKWTFNQSSLFLDFLAGNQNYQCTPWGNPTRNIFGWQKPCYLLVSEGYAQSFNELMETTPWDKYGVGVNGKCDQCQVHSGFEPTAVNDTFIHPLRALKVALLGPRTEGPMAPDMPVSPPPQGPSHPVFPLRVER
ncbi:Hopanoid biosynthesis associated radical SAM protein HpnH [Acidithiobacillus ferrivorans]|uniref:Hopanoid biosynthesis associated radical SAM protein HpnH n=2 Tax=Acidithiobacillus ferrivorans TaxID=160808 RepID=A0A060USK2_9PROT|nr:Hopanoid biosynthesis associated radical SAM protein HpnH [Acidithiobacillus ferrivorans]